jgi:5-methylcytosine-specific restriction endonuclease McrA
MIGVCEHCRAAFSRKRKMRDAGRFCSRTCAFAAKAVGGWNRGRIRSVQMSAIVIAACSECRGPFVKRAKSLRLTCSESCRQHRLHQQYRVGSRRRWNAQHPKQSKNFTCAACGAPFIRTFRSGPHRHNKFCSERCAHSACSSEARARRAGVSCDYSIKPLQVFARDRWRCQLCGVHTPKRLRGSIDSRAPELDHIVPIAAGGGHTWDNVQCACRSCNNNKGAKPLGQQRLIA